MGLGEGELEYVNYFYKESRSKKSLFLGGRGRGDGGRCGGGGGGLEGGNFLTKNPNLFKFFFGGGRWGLGGGCGGRGV